MSRKMLKRFDDDDGGVCRDDLDFCDGMRSFHPWKDFVGPRNLIWNLFWDRNQKD
jgi:hypothetical protein